MKKEKLTAADLALYLGQECQTRGGRIEKMDCVFLDGTVVFDNRFENAEHCKPILRPLSDLTEKEQQEIKGLYGLGDDQSILERDTFFASYLAAAKGSPKVWRYLLSIGIDLFGWIEAGLAIDKTKMETL